MTKIPGEVMDALTNEQTLKFLATINSSGVLNAVIVATVSALDDETIIFANLKLGKTKENLLQTKKFTISIVTPEMRNYQLRCNFIEFQESGALAKEYNEVVFNKLRIQLKEVGLAKVEGVYSAGLNSSKTKIG